MMTSVSAVNIALFAASARPDWQFPTVVLKPQVGEQHRNFLPACLPDPWKIEFVEDAANDSAAAARE